MSILEVPKPRESPKSRKPRESRKPEVPAEVYWDCPKCIYRIPLDFPGGTGEAIAAHQNGHRLAEMGITPKITYGLLRPGTPRR